MADPNLFPCNGPQRVTLPLTIPSGPKGGQIPAESPSWRVIFPREEIKVLMDSTAQGADSDGLFPINAVYLHACGCRVEGCEDVFVFVNDGISRCSVWLNFVEVIPPTGTPPTNQVVNWSIKGAADAINSPLLHGQIQVPALASNTKGLIAEVSGILCTQFEFWASVSTVGVPSPMPVNVRLQFIVDRLGSQIASYLGPVAGGKDLPPAV